MKEIFGSDIPGSKTSVFDFFRDVLSIPCRLGCITKPRKEADARQY